MYCVCCLQGLLPERKVFEVHIEQGHKYGAKVVLRGEAGMSELGVLPGDVIFVLEPKPHKTFKRVGNDLIVDKVACSPTCSVDGVLLVALLLNCLYMLYMEVDIVLVPVCGGDLIDRVTSCAVWTMLSK